MIEVRNLSKSYGGTKAVNDISLSIGKGELFGLLGPNGSGKTAMIKILTGQIKPTSGYLRVHGVDVLEDPIRVRELVGIIPVFLLPALLLFLSVSLYMVSILIYLTGISPSINLYNGRTFALYTISVMPLLLVNVILSMFGPYYVLINLLLVPPALYLLGQSFRKWDRIESPRS